MWTYIIYAVRNKCFYELKPFRKVVFTAKLDRLKRFYCAKLKSQNNSLSSSDNELFWAAPKLCTRPLMFFNHKFIYFLISVDCDALHHWLHFRGIFLYRVRIEKGSKTDFLDHSNLHQFVAKSHLPSAQCGLHIVTSCNIGYRHRKVSTFFGLFWRR